MNRMIVLAVMMATLLAADSVRAAVKLSRVFGNHMVIQQDQPIRLFGSADPGEKVTAELSGKTATATADDKGYFRVELPAMKADGKSIYEVLPDNDYKQFDCFLYNGYRERARVWRGGAVF